MIEVRDATVRDISYITANIRDVDRMELVAAGIPVEEPGTVALGALASSPDYCWCLFERGQPIGVYGVAMTGAPHIRQAWAWGTNRFARAVPTIVATHESIRRNLAKEGCLRLQAASHHAHSQSHRWLEGPMRFQLDGLMPGYGVDGSLFRLYSFVDF